MYYILEYFKFILTASNQHGVHSPFVYNLVTKCFYKKTEPNLWTSYLKIRQELLNNKNKIKVTDFGSGSKFFKNNERQISKIATVAGISNKKAKLCIRLVQYFKPKNVLEIGTSLGLGTSAIKIGNNDAKITTLEGCPATSEIAQELFNRNHLKNINILTGSFQKTLPKVTENNQFNLIYFDGNHTKKATLEYFNICLQTINNNSIWIFDDIYWSPEMKEAWNAIKQHPKVRVTVDVFHFGIVFFREEQAKENFKIRL
ncbi:O-methyltransferase [Polaribacter marinus]|nr:class I SAM-dependent methyltransferase [Polaribacter marinus]